MAALGARRLSAASCSTSYSSSQHSIRAPPCSLSTSAQSRSHGPPLPTPSTQQYTLAASVQHRHMRIAPHSSTSKWHVCARRGRPPSDLPDDAFVLGDDEGEGEEDDFGEDDDVLREMMESAAGIAKKRAEPVTRTVDGSEDEFDAEEDAEEFEEWEEWMGDEDEEEEGRSSIVDEVLSADAQGNSWDAALVEFPAEQDEVTGKEWDTEEAAGKRRLNPPGPPLNRTQIVEFIPEAEPEPEPRKEGDQYKLLTAADADKLMTNRQGYQSFDMSTFELLIAETSDGRLDLADSFIFDTAQDMYAKPEVEGKLPIGAGRYQVIPWTEEVSGDMVKYKDPSSKILKLYFIGVAKTDPYTVDMRAVYMFNSATRVMTAVKVKTLGRVVDPILQIRPDGVNIVDSGALLPFQAVAAGVTAADQQEDTTMSEEQYNEKMEELEQGMDEELDDIPDLPAADMV